MLRYRFTSKNNQDQLHNLRHTKEEREDFWDRYHSHDDSFNSRIIINIFHWVKLVSITKTKLTHLDIGRHQGHSKGADP